MKDKMPKLQKQAGNSCRNRGHNMSHFTSLSDTNAVAECLDCHMEVQCLTNPAPNEIDIGGEAVALNCPGEERVNSWKLRLDTIRHLASMATEEYGQELDEFEQVCGRKARERYEERYV